MFDIDNILTELRSERDRIDTAIAALEDGGNKPHKRRYRHMTAESRARISRRMKASWKERKQHRAAKAPVKKKAFVHWTQRPENRAKVKARLEAMRKARVKA